MDWWYNTKDKLIGTIESNGELLLLTIPYEKGLKIKVNNEYKDVLKCLDTLTCVKLDKGNNKIQVSYEQPGLKIGYLISIISFISTVIYRIKKK